MLRAFLFFVLFLGSQFLGLAALLLWTNWSLLQQGQVLDSALLLQATPAQLAISSLGAEAILLLCLYIWRGRGCLRGLQLRRALPAWSGGLLIGFLLFALGLSLLLHPLDLQDPATLAQMKALAAHPLGVVLFVIGAPLTEECVFRAGILQSLLRKSYAPLWAVGLSALSFAMVHDNWAQAVPAFVLGLLLGLLYLRMGNLRLAFSAHVLNNILALLELRLPGFEQSLQGWPTSLVLALGALLLGLGGWIFVRSYGIAQFRQLFSQRGLEAPAATTQATVCRPEEGRGEG